MQQIRTAGIDIGKKQLHISTPTPAHPRDWPVLVIDFADRPDWHRIMQEAIAPGAIVAMEPTGIHLSSPVITVLTQLCAAHVWYVGHGTTGQIRDTHISTSKTDHFDARALAMAAEWIAAGKPPGRARQHDTTLEAEVFDLRQLVNNRRRQTRTSARLTNRLHAYAHALYPALDQKFTTWLRLARQGIITPRQIIDYAADFPPDTNYRQNRWVDALAQWLPPVNTPEYLRYNVADAIAELEIVEAHQAALTADIETIMSSPRFAETTRRLMTIPSAGSPANLAPYIVATHGLLAEMHPDEVKAAIGISARTDTSGSKDRTRASKGGYKPAGEALYMWALLLCNPNAKPNPIRDYHQKISSTNKWKPFRATRAKLAKLISGVARSPEGYQYK